MSGEHSVLPPSGAKSWRKCPLWVTMNHRYPQADSPASMEGTAAHWVAWEMYAGRHVSEGMQAPNGIYVTGEMIEGSELMVDTLSSLSAEPWRIEEPVSITSVHPECWGTPDAWSFSSRTMTLDVPDYKFGHRYVDEYENEQGMLYVRGILDTLGSKAPGLLDQAVTVRFTIVQPRCFVRGAPVRTWTVNAADLRGHLNELSIAAAAALGPNPAAVTNSECGDCPGRHACPALQQGGYCDAEIAYRSGPVELPPEAASLELRMLEHAYNRLGARVDGLREAVTAYGRQGFPTPYHRLEQGYGRQQWTVPVEEVVVMGELLGVDVKKPGVMTPKQAIKAGIDASVISAYSDTPRGSIKLIPTNPADARRVFGNT